MGSGKRKEVSGSPCPVKNLPKLVKKRFLLLERWIYPLNWARFPNSPRFFSSFLMILEYITDATAPSKLENILNNYDFKSDKRLMETSKEAIEKILEYKISKYNDFEIKDLLFLKTSQKRF